MGAYKYKAFISYSHKDERWARWLHRRLENYPIPTHLTGNRTGSEGTLTRLKPIFRDREELAAANSLGEKIEQALADSESLIIICSPHAANSHWVNQEIISFKRQNRGAKIFSLIVDGEPFATNTSDTSNTSARTAEECFPEALRFQVDTGGNLTKEPAEPLAADIRTKGDGKRLGFLKLVTGMIGVGLDEIVQRDMRRGRKRVMAITASALVVMIAMGTLTGFALSARKDAELRRNDAEENIEFMITDLKKELGKVGSLGAMKVIGERAKNYYDKYPITKHNDEALGRRARVFHYLGEILNTEGYRDDADKYFKRAYAATAELFARDPENADRIFEHAQSAYYAGFVLWNASEYNQARPFFDEYIVLAKALKRVEPDSLRAKKEVTYAYTNLGILLFKQGYAKDAIEIYRTAIPAYEEMALEYPKKIQHQMDLVNAYAWIADAALKIQKLDLAIEYRKLQKEIYRNIIEQDPLNYDYKYQDLSASLGLAKLYYENKILKAALLVTTNLENVENLHKKDLHNADWAKLYIFYKLMNIEILIKQQSFELAQNALDSFLIVEERLQGTNVLKQEDIQIIAQKRKIFEMKINKYKQPMEKVNE